MTQVISQKTSNQFVVYMRISTAKSGGIHSNGIEAQERDINLFLSEFIISLKWLYIFLLDKKILWACDGVIRALIVMKVFPAIFVIFQLA